MKTNQPLNEGLEKGDLDNWVESTITVDRFKSKMGEDQDIVVLGFKVKDKLPAMDLMEFIERGYPFILDSDISGGEERDGYYHVFVEIPRTEKLSGQIQNLFSGVSNLTNCFEWKFTYQKSKKLFELTSENIKKEIPLTAQAYERKLLELKNSDVSRFFDQGATEVNLQEDNTIEFSKPFSGTLRAKFLAIGNYNALKNKFNGPLSLDESSQSQVLFLTKYLGNYDIDKVGNIFLIRNGNRGIALTKDTW